MQIYLELEDSLGPFPLTMGLLQKDIHYLYHNTCTLVENLGAKQCKTTWEHVTLALTHLYKGR
jgi:hypothetical protein